MLNRCSVNFLLKSLIVLMSGTIVVTFGLDAWRGYSSYRVADRVAILAKTAGAVAAATNQLNLDKAFTDRALNMPTVSDADRKRVTDARDAELGPLKQVLATLADNEFAAGKADVAALKTALPMLERMQQQTLDAFAQPKAARAALDKDFVSLTGDMLDSLDKLGKKLEAQTKTADPTIAQLLMLKDLAWATRAAAANATVVVSGSIIAGKLVPDGENAFITAMAQANSAWSLLEATSADAVLPAKFTDAAATAKRTYFAPDLLKLQDDSFKKLVAGEKVDIAPAAWSARFVPAVNSLLNVAVAALDSASDRAADLRDAALRTLAIEFALLAIALALAVGSFFAVGARVIRPLLAIRDAMVKLAGGNLDVDVGYTERRDEIGALAGTLASFKANAVEKQRIEDEQKQRHADAAKRQEMIDLSIKAFEKEIGGALQALDKASSDMRDVSQAIAGAASQGDRQVQVVVGAAAEASKHVDVVAGSAEELSAASDEISGQVTRAADIASRAVEEARQTDSTMQSLVGTTSRIGEVVDFINDIAGQTNLLALNATIEAARAGEAGKGFAVVASEVKSLASQTAKATQDISEQIVAVQNVTKDAVEAIQRIGGTISEVSAVANSIAAAVRQQAAATQEIKRSTEEAARRSGEVSSNMTHVAAATEKTGGAAQGVQDTAKALGTEADRLREEVNGFLAKMRAA